MTNQELLTIIIALGGLILTVGIALAGFILAQSLTTRSERHDIRNQIGELRDCMAHLEGLLEGLCEAITRQPVARAPRFCSTKSWAG